jgi:hypothetical protein
MGDKIKEWSTHSNAPKKFEKIIMLGSNRAKSMSWKLHEHYGKECKGGLIWTE